MSRRGDNNRALGGPQPNQIFTYLGHPNKKSKISGASSEITDWSNNHFRRRNNEHSNFLYVYFLFAYYLLLAPFRLRKVDSGKFEICRWLPQQVLCGFATALLVLRLCTSMRSSLESLKTNDPVSFFGMFSEVSGCIFKTTMFVGFWTKAEAHLRVVNYVSKNQYILPYNPFKMESVTTLSSMYGSYAVMSFFRFFFGSGWIKIWDWTPEIWYRKSVSDAWYTFFMSNGTTINGGPALHEISSVDTFIACIQCLSVLYRHVFSIFADLCVLIHILTLWAPTVAFTNSKRKELAQFQEMNFDDDSISYVGSGQGLKIELETTLKQFDALKKLSGLIEDAVGAGICPFIAEALYYYAVSFGEVVLTNDLLRRVVLTFFYTTALGIVIFSSEIVRKMRWLKPWLCEQGRIELIEENRLALILDDLSNDSVGISASGIFTINYNFVGTFVSVLITYFIIRLQSEPEKKA